MESFAVGIVGYNVGVVVSGEVPNMETPSYLYPVFFLFQSILFYSIYLIPIYCTLFLFYSIFFCCFFSFFLILLEQINFHCLHWCLICGFNGVLALFCLFCRTRKLSSIAKENVYKYFIKLKIIIQVYLFVCFFFQVSCDISIIVR